MLRTITQYTEAMTELRRIRDRTQDEQVPYQESTVREILATVKRQGDHALLTYTAEFDQQTLSLEQIKLTGAELDAAYQQISPEVLEALRFCCERLTLFHQHRLPKNWVQFRDQQVVLGQRYSPVGRAGVYIGGRQTPAPSKVLMTAIPARVAGVPQIVMALPPGQALHPAVLVAAQEVGITEIYRVGGAQAIAAMAYGTETIAAVDVIAGAGNIYVTLAKKLVYGSVGLDLVALSSELIVIADVTARPADIAADLLAQSATDALAAAILITPDATLATQVALAVSQQLEQYPHSLATEKAIAHFGLIIVTTNLEAALTLANNFAPSHLALAIADPWAYLPQIQHAGTILLGVNTPKTVSNYSAGPTAVQPTSGASRYSSGLSVETFLKPSNLIQYSAPALQTDLNAIDLLAGLEAQAAQTTAINLRNQANSSG